MHRKAFTLIELLVVIAIIALLVSILTPSLQTAKELARDTVCLARQQSLGRGFLQYWEEFEHRNPYFRYPYSSSEGPRTYWPWFMRDFVGLGEGNDENMEPNERNAWAAEQEHFNCPSALGSATWSQPDHPDTLTHAMSPYGIREGEEYTPGITSYGLNWELSCSLQVQSDPNWCYPSIIDLPYPWRTGLVLDAGRTLFRYGGWVHCPGCNNSYDPRHRGHVNMLLVDGHVESRDFEWFYPINEDAQKYFSYVGDWIYKR